MKLSIIIPAYNEEKYLPRLLKSINAQRYPCEVIVADAESEDATRMIARAFGCEVVNARRGKPAYARNAGALAASGDLLLFLDADVILTKNFLRDNVYEFLRRRLDVAGGYLKSTGRGFFDFLAIDFFANLWLYFSQYTSPDVFGACIFAHKRAFHLVGGFDETITFGEDLDFVKRVHKRGARFRMLGKPAFVSMRRFDKEGRVNLTSRYLALHTKRFFGKIKEEIDYEFGKY